MKDWKLQLWIDFFDAYWRTQLVSHLKIGLCWIHYLISSYIISLAPNGTKSLVESHEGRVEAVKVSMAVC